MNTTIYKLFLSAEEIHSYLDDCKQSVFYNWIDGIKNDLGDTVVFLRMSEQQTNTCLYILSHDKYQLSFSPKEFFELLDINEEDRVYLLMSSPECVHVRIVISSENYNNE